MYARQFLEGGGGIPGDEDEFQPSGLHGGILGTQGTRFLFGTDIKDKDASESGTIEERAGEDELS